MLRQARFGGGRRDGAGADEILGRKCSPRSAWYAIFGLSSARRARAAIGSSEPRERQLTGYMAARRGADEYFDPTGMWFSMMRDRDNHWYRLCRRYRGSGRHAH